MKASDINSIDSEAGVIATLIHNPDYIYYSEALLPNHFTNTANCLVYTAIQKMSAKNIHTVDPYMIMETLNSEDTTRKMAEDLSIDRLHELMEASDILARNSAEEYKVLVGNVLDAAFRRDLFQRFRECEALCYDRSKDNIEQKVYAVIDDVMTEYSTTEDIPPYAEVVDACWEEIRARQGAGYSGTPFKFRTLNDYVTIEKGELIVFAAEQKQGKSMFLLNCAVDLLKQDKAVLYLDSELNTTHFTKRILSHLTGIRYRDLTSGNYGSDDARRIEEAKAWIKTRKFTHLYIPMFDIQSIYTAAKKVQHTQGLDVLIVDYFKSSAEGDAWENYAELGRFTDLVKNQIAGDMGIAAIGAAQATATGKVADSAKIGRNASTLCLISDKTPEEIEQDGEECGNKKLRVVFNRNGSQMSPGEYIDMLFDGDHISYEEAPRQHIPTNPF